jgi:hypothetical protein
MVKESDLVPTLVWALTTIFRQKMPFTAVFVGVPLRPFLSALNVIDAGIHLSGSEILPQVQNPIFGWVF